MSFNLRTTSQTETLPKFLLQFDGGANPNPGPCAGAFVISKIDTQEILFEGGTFMDQGTNNIGEYMGLLEGLKVCKENKLDSILIQGDSKLVVYQVTNKWKINYDHIRKLYQEIQELLKNFTSVSIRHVYREENKRADELSDETLEKKKNWIRF
jgi:ribonuclease HI